MACLMQQQSLQKGDQLQGTLARVEAMKDLAGMNVDRPEDRTLLVAWRRYQLHLLAEAPPQLSEPGQQPDISLVLNDHSGLGTGLGDLLADGLMYDLPMGILPAGGQLGPTEAVTQLV